MPFIKQLPDLHDRINTVDKNLLIELFLKNCDIRNFKLQLLEGDASKRRYGRVHSKDKSYILMDSSQELKACAAFMQIGRYLRQNAINVPDIYAENVAEGLLLLEDFGDVTLRQYIQQNPSAEAKVYSQAVDILLKVKQLSPEFPLERYDNQKLFAELDLFLEWYVKSLLPINVFVDAKIELRAVFAQLYQGLGALQKCLTLKDYMADNIMVIEDAGKATLGLLDFQDALYGYAGYDLVSLLQDARLEVSQGVVEACLAQFTAHLAQHDIDKFMCNYIILGAHRNLRIIGCFHRLAKSFGKKRYLDYLPLVWQHINANLEHHCLQDVKKWFLKYGLYPTRFESWQGDKW